MATKTSTKPKSKSKKAQPNQGANMLKVQAGKKSNILKDLDKNLYLCSHKGTSKDFDKAWQLLLTAKSFAIDLETYHPVIPNSAKGGLEYDAKVRLISLSPCPGTALVFDLGCINYPETLPPPEMEKYLTELKLLCEDRSITKIGHNIQFDMLRLRVDLGWELVNIKDTMIMSQVLFNAKRGKSADKGSDVDPDLETDEDIEKDIEGHSLGELAKRLGLTISKEEQASDWGEGEYEYGNLSLEQYQYSFNDTLTLWQLLPKLDELARKEKLSRVFKTEFAFTEVLVEMSYNGLFIDEEKAKEIRELYQQEYDKYTKEIRSVFGADPTNKELLECLNLKFTEKDVLVSSVIFHDIKEPLSGVSENQLRDIIDLPGIKAILERRTVKQGLDVLDSFLGKARDKYIHPSFFQHVITARTSSKNPNFQNIPSGAKLPKHMKGFPALRQVFKAPAGCKFIISDLASAHARIATQASKDEKLIEFYKDTTKDIHLYTASLVAKAMGRQDLSFEGMTEIYNNPSHPEYKEIKRMRNIAKTVFYGSLNLQGPGTLQNTLKEAGETISLADAKAILAEYKQGYAGLSAYIERVLKDSRKVDYKLQGSAKRYAKIYNLTGRFAYYPKEWGGQAKANDLVAFIWMSTEAEIMKESAVLFLRECKANPHWGARLINFVHDEINAYCLEEYAEEVAKALSSIMSGCSSYWVKCIPPDKESLNYKNCIKDSWADK